MLGRKKFTKDEDVRTSTYQKFIKKEPTKRKDVQLHNHSTDFKKWDTDKLMIRGNGIYS